MSADLMLIDKNSNAEKKQENCIFVDETSMGESNYEFSQLLRNAGEINEQLIKDVERWNESLTKHPDMDIKKVIQWLKDHNGQYVNMECW